MTLEFATKYPEVFLQMRRMYERLTHSTSVRMQECSAVARCSCGWYDVIQTSDYSLSKDKRTKTFEKANKSAEFHWRAVGI